MRADSSIKKFLPTFCCILLLSITLTGCDLTASKDQQISSSSQQIQTDETQEENFAQKVQCQKYLNDVQRKLESMYEYPDESSTYFYKLFYSKKANSCVYKWKEENWFKGNHSGDNFYLTDALTGEHLVYVSAVWGKPEIQDYNEREQKFEQEVKPYEE